MGKVTKVGSSPLIYYHAIATRTENTEASILGDPGADSRGEGKSKQAGKYGTREK